MSYEYIDTTHTPTHPLTSAHMLVSELKTPKASGRSSLPKNTQWLLKVSDHFEGRLETILATVFTSTHPRLVLVLVLVHNAKALMNRFGFIEIQRWDCVPISVNEWGSAKLLQLTLQKYPAAGAATTQSHLILSTPN